MVKIHEPLSIDLLNSLLDDYGNEIIGLDDVWSHIEAKLNQIIR